MKKLPYTEDSLLIRTDFTNDAAWESLCHAVTEPSKDGFTACLKSISDSDYQGLTPTQLIALAPRGEQRGQHSFAFIADATTFANNEHPILVVDLFDQPGRTFRAIPREIWSVENNLSTANMEYQDFANNTDSNGIFRGFPTT